MLYTREPRSRVCFFSKPNDCFCIAGLVLFIWIVFSCRFSAETVQGSPRKGHDNVEEHKKTGTTPFVDCQQTGTASRKHGTSENRKYCFALF